MNNNRGFTLIEVLASIMILAIIVTSFFQFFIFSQKSTMNSQDKLVGINIAQKVLEQIKEEAEKSDSYPTKSQYWIVTHPNDQNYVKTYQGAGYKEMDGGKTYFIKIDVIAEKPESNLYMITVSVNGSDNKCDSTVKGLVEL